MAKLFEFGGVECVCADSSTRQMAVRMSCPWCVAQAATPLLLGHGFIDQFKVRTPLVAWVPALTMEHFADGAVAQVPNIADKATAMMRERATDALQLFADLAQVLRNPDAALHMLPMGTYVEFQYRGTYESFAAVLAALEPLGTPGVAELRYAMAEVLAEALAAAGSCRPFELEGADEPALLGPAAAAHSADAAAPARPAPIANLFGKR